MTDKKTDAVGPSLLPKEKARSESAARSHYARLFGTVVFVQGPIIAWTLYLITKYLSSEVTKQVMKTKFDFLYDYQLNYVYIALYMIALIRMVLQTNANGTRGPTGLDRPDQHIYQIEGTTDLVLMANEGVNGRFNRGQRGLFNMDESLPLMTMNTLLVGTILGPVVCGILVPLYAYGRITFAHDYTKDGKTRGGAFFFCAVAEYGMSALVGLIAIKSTFGPLIPI